MKEMNIFLLRGLVYKRFQTGYMISVNLVLTLLTEEEVIKTSSTKYPFARKNISSQEDTFFDSLICLSSTCYFDIDPAQSNPVISYLRFHNRCKEIIQVALISIFKGLLSVLIA
jgi:hypothetical protein